MLLCPQEKARDWLVLNHDAYREHFTDSWMDNIVDAVSDLTEFSQQQLMGPRRTKYLSRARWLVFHMLKQQDPKISFAAIGRYMGVDHSSVIYGLGQMKQLLESSAPESAYYRHLKQEVTKRTDGRF